MIFIVLIIQFRLRNTFIPFVKVDDGDVGGSKADKGEEESSNCSNYQVSLSNKLLREVKEITSA